MTQRRQTDAQTTSLTAQTVIQFRRQHPVEFHYLRTITMHFRQTKRQRWFIYLRQHFAKEADMFRLTDTQPSLCDQIAERCRHRQVILLSVQINLNFTVHHVQCGMVANQMMQQLQYHPTTIILFLRRHKPQQRRLIQIKTIMTRIKTLSQLFTNWPIRRVQRQFSNR